MTSTLVEVSVKLRSKFSRIAVDENGDLLAYLKSSPIENKANLELLSLLLKYLKVSKRCLSIKSGVKSRHKLIEISNEQ